jgi:hypothetical protein
MDKEQIDEQPTLREFYVDFLSNQPKNEIGLQNAANRLRWQLERRIEASAERYWDLPQLIVYPEGEYLALLQEARQLYIDGYFYSCVAMCGIVNERLIKDTLRASILIEKDGKVERPASKVFDQLERVEVRGLAQFIREAGLLNEEAFDAAKKLGDLRNDYAHARGRQSQNDALKAIKWLHQVVEGTVSVLKDHEIKDGVFVRKKIDGESL